jgi:hypothetical protein
MKPRQAAPAARGPEGPFPMRQVFVICLGMFGCAFNMSVLFPFIPFLVEDLGAPPPRAPQRLLPG